jgi:hypothetical protein
MNCGKRLSFLVAVTLASALAASLRAPAQSVGSKGEGGSKPDVFYGSIAGQWVGSLEYRDYSNDRRVTLPTTLTAQITKEVP